MTDFLIILAKINVGVAVAILIVALLRQPMRRVFHARVGYTLWLLVPVAALASVLPPRVVAVAVHPVSIQIPGAIGRAVQTRLIVQAAPFDWTSALFALWLAGAGVMLLAMAWQQRQFHKAERLGVAGPAVTGFLRPRIVIPSGFAAQFSAPEQAAILAHEEAHLQRQDARINAAVAVLRCLCWFNLLVHLGATWLRRDQELACDATAITRVPPIDYANALLKSQMRAMSLPLGCAWPGSEHPLTERVALLKFQPPKPARHRAGIGMVVTLAFVAGFAAWAAQPGQSASAATVATAQTNAHASGAHFAIRVVDESIAKGAAQGPAGDDHVRFAGKPQGLWLKRDGQIDGNALADAHTSIGQDGKPVIEFTLTPKARDQFAEMTRENIGHRLAVVVNDTVITAPVVRTPMLSGRGQITGNFHTEADANALAAEMMGTKQVIKP